MRFSYMCLLYDILVSLKWPVFFFKTVAVIWKRFNLSKTDYSVYFSISIFPCTSQCHLQREGLLSYDTLLISKLCSPQRLTITFPSCSRCAHALEAVGVTPVWLAHCMFALQHVTCTVCDKLLLYDLVVLGQSERNWCCTKIYVNTYIIYIGISECYCCLSTNQGPGHGLGAFRGSLYLVL